MYIRIKNIMLSSLVILLATGCASKVNHKQVCSEALMNQLDNTKGFKILHYHSSPLDEIKLEVGKYEDATETVVSLGYSTTKIEDGLCLCYFDKDGELLNKNLESH